MLRYMGDYKRLYVYMIGGSEKVLSFDSQEMNTPLGVLLFLGKQKCNAVFQFNYTV